MENKYFTPDIEDIRVGYECEIWWCCGEPREWVKTIATLEDEEEYAKLTVSDIAFRIGHGDVRVPYLTKEQIEAEGWTEFITEYRGDIKLENMNYVFFNEKSNYMLGWFFNRNQIGLLVKDPAKALDINGNIINYNDAPRYTGECKDINTFRKIIKLLGI